MKTHVLTTAALLLALACYAADLTGPGLALFFVSAALEIAIWLHTVQSPRRSTARLLTRIAPRR